MTLVLVVGVIGVTVLLILLMVMLDERHKRRHEIHLRKLEHRQYLDEVSFEEEEAR